MSFNWSGRRALLANPAAIGLLVLAVFAVVAALLAARAFAVNEGFVPRADSPVPVTSVTIDPSTNLIYAQENGGTRFFRYDPRDDTWTELLPAPINSGNNGGAAYLDGKIYTSYTGNDDQLGVYDISTGTWSTEPNPLSDESVGGTGNITAVGNDLYLVVRQVFVRYNPATDAETQLADPPAFADSCGPGFQQWGGLEPLDGKIYGHEGNGCKGFAVYDIAADEWTRLPDVPDNIGGEGTDNAALLGAAIDPESRTYYTYGGYGEGHFHRFDIDAGSWSTIDFPEESLDDGGMAYVSIPGRRGIYATFGESETGFTRYRLNSDPQARNNSYGVDEDGRLDVPPPGVLGNDSDPDGDPITAQRVSGPSHGSLTLRSNGSFTYRPDANYSGPDSFRYRANDGDGGSDVATVRINVRSQPDGGSECTINGTPGNDILRGTPRRDVICGRGGNDIIYGLGGDDELRGGGGNDVLRGGDGKDRLSGNVGNDQLLGGDGPDELDGGSGADNLSGQQGRDSLDASDGVRENDTANGGRGPDSCSADRGDERTSC